MSRVIVDTNILISATIADRDPEAVILFIIANQDRFNWVVSAEILAEYKAVLSRPRLKLTEAQQEEWLSLLDDSTTLIEVNTSIDFPRDRKDAKFLACAVAANADFLITGDRDFSEAQRLVNTQIISISMFKQLMAVDGEDAE